MVIKKQNKKKQRTILFITGNKNKLREAREILSDEKIINKKIDLPEQQGDSLNIIKEKTKTAVKILNKPVIVEDTNLRYDALNGMPGPYIKDFLRCVGRDGLYKILAGYKNKKAEAVALIGYGEPGKKPIVFEGKVRGKIVKPRGELKFGFDPVFQPDGFKKTFAEMGSEEKNKISHRRRALMKLKKYLERKI